MWDSFFSVQPFLEDTKWHVNLRGSRAREIGRRLEKIPRCCVTYNQGDWIGLCNRFTTENRHEYEYVLIWLEDHICMEGALIEKVCNDMHDTLGETLYYTCFQGGLYRESHYNLVAPSNETELIVVYDRVRGQRVSSRADPYLFSVASITCIRVLEFITSKRYDHPHGYTHLLDAPFACEVDSSQDWLKPIRSCLPKTELFASIDDDHGVPGSCLIARGLYPDRLGKRSSYADGNE